MIVLASQLWRVSLIDPRKKEPRTDQFGIVTAFSDWKAAHLWISERARFGGVEVDRENGARFEVWVWLSEIHRHKAKRVPVLVEVSFKVTTPDVRSLR